MDGEEGSFMQSLRSEPFRRRVFDNNPFIEVRVTAEAEGDCMYSSIVAAMSPEQESTTEPQIFQVLSESQLRDVVAHGATDEVLQQYAGDHDRGMAHTEFMDSVKNLEDLRQQIRQPRLVWGDSYALAELARHLDIVFLLWSEPLVPLRRYNSGYPFVSIPAPPVSRDDKQLRYIMLQHTRREHYNLITWNQKAVFRLSDLPPVVQERWSHIWNDQTSDDVSSDTTGPDGESSRRRERKRPASNSEGAQSAKRSRMSEASATSSRGGVNEQQPEARRKVTKSRGKAAEAAASGLSKASQCGRFGHFANCQCHIKHKLSFK